MPLTDEEKTKIIEEERLRAQARAQFAGGSKKKGFGHRELKHPFRTAVLIITALIAVFAFLLSGDDEGKQTTGSAVEQASVTPDSNANLNPEEEEQRKQVAEQRKSYNDKRGNNAEAAATAEALESILILAGMEKGSIDLYAEVSAPDEARKQYEAGGDEKEYRSAATTVRLIAVVKNSMWTFTSDSTKKDLVTSFIKALKVDYPNAIPTVIVNNGIRTVAEGSWSVWSGEPKVDLK